MFFTLCVVWATAFVGFWALLGFAVSWATPLVGLRRLLAFGRYWATPLLGFGVDIRAILLR